MALDNIPTLGPGSLNSNLDKVLVYKNGGSEVAVSLLTLTNSALNLSGVYLDTVNGRIGIGTPSPTGTLTVKGIGTTSSTTALSVQNSAGTTAFTIKDNGVTNATYMEGGMCWFNNVNSNGIVKFGSSMSVGFNTDPIATAQIKGSGSTSATTSLLVQNSSGTNLLNVRDDAKTIIPTGGGGTIVMGSLNANTNGMSLVGYYADGSNSAIYTENYNNGTLKTYLGGAFYGVTTDLTQTFSNGSRGGIGFRVTGNVNNTGGSFGDIGGYTFEPNILSLTGGSVIYAFNSTIGGAYFNTNTRQASAILQADSTTKGFLKPKMTTAQKNAIVTPTAGLEVYDTDLNRPCFYNGTSWITL